VRIETKATKAAEALSAWREQYEGKWHLYTFAREVEEKLAALGDSPTPEQVNEVIGNTGWTDVRCTECLKYHDAVVVVVLNDDAEVHLCRLCLDKATSMLLEEVRKNRPSCVWDRKSRETGCGELKDGPPGNYCPFCGGKVEVRE
jgi:hypothetical protein